jgi:hypothetical protein
MTTGSMQVCAKDNAKLSLLCYMITVECCMIQHFECQMPISTLGLAMTCNVTKFLPKKNILYRTRQQDTMYRF